MEFGVKCLEFAKNDFKKRYAGSFIGGLWAYIQTVAMVLIYWLVFEFGMHNSSVNGIPFLPWFISGIMPWLLFSDIISTSMGCMLEYNYIVKKIVFNINIIPLSKVLVSLFTHAFLLIVCMLVSALYGLFTGWQALTVLYYLTALLCLAVPYAFALSAVCVFIRDFSQIVGILLNILMWGTPIIWNINVVPEHWRWIFQLNPMFYVINGFRNTLIRGCNQEMTILYIIYFWAFVLIGGFFCFRLYKKLVFNLADLL